jgi:hypothetical protein
VNNTYTPLQQLIAAKDDDVKTAAQSAGNIVRTIRLLPPIEELSNLAKVLSYPSQTHIDSVAIATPEQTLQAQRILKA